MQPTDLDSPSVPVDADRQPFDLSTEPAVVKKRAIGTLLRHPVVSQVLTASAGVFVFAALIFPNVVSRLTPLAFVRIPIEAAALVVLLLVLPDRVRRSAAVVVGVLLGLLMLEKCLDMGFFDELNRPFDPVLDWVLFDDAFSFATDAYGQTAAILTVAAIIALVLAVLSLSVWSVLRISALIGRHRRSSVFTAGSIAVTWSLTLVLGAHLFDTVPVAARSTITYAIDRAQQARAGFADESAFAKEVQVDAFKNTPPAQLVSALAGKDVIFTFVESYGRSAVETPALAPAVDRVLDDGTATLKAAGFAARSGWLTSPTYGGGSWLAHSTLESGLWIDNQQRYRDLVSSNRRTLTSVFAGAKWRTVSVMPGTTRAWPEGRFYGYDAIWDSRNLGYQGPRFSWAPMPDQYTLKQLNTIEYKKAGRSPLMIEMPLVSSHTPWAPIPQYLSDWSQVGDGSIYTEMVKTAQKPKALWQNPHQVQQEYGKSLQYTLTSLINWVRLYADPNLVLVFLGDHQPAPIASGLNASHDVPISIVAKDPAVLDKITSWGWQDGLRPSPTTPVWPMSDFRDKFFTAFGSSPNAAH